MSERTCEWGFAELCGKPATWRCNPDKFPGDIFACDEHGPKMCNAVLAHRLPSAPPMPLPYLHAYVTALAWDAYLNRETNPLRAENARSGFRMYREEYERRSRAAV